MEVGVRGGEGLRKTKNEGVSSTNNKLQVRCSDCMINYLPNNPSIP